jgi:hypothetical protein
MPFRKSQFKKIEQEINDVSRSNRIDNIKDLSQEIRIKALETLLNSLTIIITNSTQTNKIADLKSRLSALETRYNKTFSQN